MYRQFFFLAFLVLAPWWAAAQDSYAFALKLPVGAAVTQRFGLQIEVPLHARWSLDLEGRYLAQDWLPKGGEPFRSLEKAEGFGLHGGLRHYFLGAPGEAFRLLALAQYRYRHTRFLGFFERERDQHEVNLQLGAQFRTGRFVAELQVGGAQVSERSRFIGVSEPSDFRYTVPRVDVLVGLAF